LNCRRSEIDTPVSIRFLKRFVADWEPDESVKSETAQTPEDRRRWSGTEGASGDRVRKAAGYCRHVVRGHSCLPLTARRH
jgi:hypothetical protein